VTERERTSHDDAPHRAADDAPTLAAQMGRPLAGTSEVVSRCRLELPVVIEVHPDVEGRPFPTLYYLTCPLARARVSRLEAEGGVRAAQERLERDPELARRHAAAQADYARLRAAKLAAGSVVRDRLRGGVGGAEGGVKCLHAHYAHARAGHANPIGEDVARAIEPLDCATPCVTEGARDPRWREPAAP
jgi:hypothetical protein